MKILIIKRKGGKLLMGSESGCGLSGTALTSALLGVAGTAAKMVANSNARGAMDSQVSAEMQRQKQFREQGQSLVNQQIERSTQPQAEQAIGSGANKAQGMYTTLNAVPLTSSAPSSPVAASATSGGNAGARTAIFNRAAAPIQGLSEWQTKEAIDSLKTRTLLNQIQDFSRGSAGVLPAEINQAQHSQDGLASLGGVLSGVGSLVGGIGSLIPSAARSVASGSTMALAGGSVPTWSSAATMASGIPGSWTSLPMSLLRPAGMLAVRSPLTW